MEHKRITFGSRVAVRVTDDLAERLAIEAARQCVRPQDLVRAILSSYLTSLQQPATANEQSPLVETQG